jgi:flagellar basal-body rod protein FlgB
MSSFINFNSETQALDLCEQRAALIARNLANSNTPKFKAQDLNFAEAMDSVVKGTPLEQTNAQHLGGDFMQSSQSLYYRIPMQHKLNENTVDDEIERKNFIENSLRYQMTVGAIERKAAQYMKAIRGD